MENTIEKDDFFGAILQDDPRDYRLGGTSIEIPEIKTSTNEYNQLEFREKYGSNLCTLYAPIGMLSDLLDTTIAERDELCSIRSKMTDFDPSVGGYLVEGNNCVRRWWNSKNPDRQIRQFAIEIGSDDFYTALKRGHRINIGYRGNKAYNDDANDGVLDHVNIGTGTYGHSTTCKLVNGEVIVDSYKGVKKYNIYSIKDFKAFIESGIVFKTAYMFLFTTPSIDEEIAHLKAKYKDSGIIFNEDKIKEYREALKR